jgi:hypothetical protein
LHTNEASGEVTRSRSASVVDWGWEQGSEDAFGRLLLSLAAEARHLGRAALTICEPSPGRLPDTGMPGRRAPVAVFTPSLQPPPGGSIHGLCMDMLYV